MHLVENLGSVMVRAYECVSMICFTAGLFVLSIFSRILLILLKMMLYLKVASLHTYVTTSLLFFFTDDTNMTLKKLLIFKVVF